METGTCKWVSVSDKLPSLTEAIVLHCGIPTYAHVEIRGNNTVWVNSWGSPVSFTHWLSISLPPIPKQKVKKEGWVVMGDIYKGSLEEGKGWVKVTYEEEV